MCDLTDALRSKAYPRSRGATQLGNFMFDMTMGLSPLARGNLRNLGLRLGVFGPIPARAGQPRPAMPWCWPWRAYPRSRGTTRIRCNASRAPLGLSPLARGNPGAAGKSERRVGPIPARAGQPALEAHALVDVAAYPRSRGATASTARCRAEKAGLSPLARGNLRPLPIQGLPTGPIPARAGQPCAASGHGPSHWAYPRSRGATGYDLPGNLRFVGLSPLARGNRCDRLPQGRSPGPIPARAGQPCRCPAGRGAPTAYPRSRGATHWISSGYVGEEGLSPLARGNRTNMQVKPFLLGPIPARAGQPAKPFWKMSSYWAYPRSRGATCGMNMLDIPDEGLSPLARGNRVGGAVQVVVGGPIPARAGQPPWRRAVWPWPGAYPRSRGATGRGGRTAGAAVGLSPLARGNPGHDGQRGRRNGPIPARAGQPTVATMTSREIAAYPRSRGATVRRVSFSWLPMGLSPLARGNPCRRLRAYSNSGPIPARAGQPESAVASEARVTAYPRSRGATSIAYMVLLSWWGLSPLARGNRLKAAGNRLPAGPIPARAGQPAAWARFISVCWAYPRSRGATRGMGFDLSPQTGLSPLARGNPAGGQGGHADRRPIPARAGQPGPRRQ